MQALRAGGGVGFSPLEPGIFERRIELGLKPRLMPRFGHDVTCKACGLVVESDLARWTRTGTEYAEKGASLDAAFPDAGAKVPAHAQVRARCNMKALRAGS